MHLYAWIPAGHQRTHVHRCASPSRASHFHLLLFNSSFDLNFQLCWKVADSVVLVVLSCESKHTSQKKKNPPKSLGKIPPNPSRPAGNVDIQGPACSEVGARQLFAKIVQCKVKRHVVSCWHWNLCVTIALIRQRICLSKKQPIGWADMWWVARRAAGWNHQTPD